MQVGGLAGSILFYRVVAGWPWIVVLPLAVGGQAVQCVVARRRFAEHRRSRLARPSGYR